LDEAIKKRDSQEWTSKDYREFVKYQKAIDKSIIARKLEEKKNIDTSLV